jgi:hypothetical protein
VECGIVVGVQTKQCKNNLQRDVTMTTRLEGGSGQSVTITMQGVAKGPPRQHNKSASNNQLAPHDLA